MKKYTLNSTPIRTANNFGINDIDLELELPQVKNFENVMIITSEMDKLQINKIENESLNLKSRIGLEEINNNYSLNIIVPKENIIHDPIIINCDFDDENNCLVDNIKITMEENSESTFILKYKSEDKEKAFHYLKQETIAKENSKGKIVIANMLNKSSDSFIAIENKEESNAKIDYVLVELGGKNKISNYYSKLEGNFAENNLKTIYLGTEKDIIDINYNIEVYGENSKCTIDTQGAVDDESRKNFKGIIDFKKGCKNSKGIENENCMILSNASKSKSLPILLCQEENVEGEHGVSSGKIDESKIFYIMTKGISYKDAKKLIVKANFNKIIKEIEYEDLRFEIIGIIDKKI